jgi:hypothetical protein
MSTLLILAFVLGIGWGWIIDIPDHWFMKPGDTCKCGYRKPLPNDPNPHRPTDSHDDT